MNPGPLTPEARIMPLDQAATDAIFEAHLLMVVTGLWPLIVKAHGSHRVALMFKRTGRCPTRIHTSWHVGSARIVARVFKCLSYTQ